MTIIPVKLCWLYAFLLASTLLQAQSKSYSINTFHNAPQIDGMLNDSCWTHCKPITDLVQHAPNFNTPPTQKTEIVIGYNNEAIFIGAMMYDTAPDSIVKQLGNRDDEVNADLFAVQFDTYDLQNDAFTFVVSASGVQQDFKVNDQTYSAVWESEVKILPNGWSCEMKINYAALRFPKEAIQEWGFQIYRVIRRKRELIEWSLEKREAANPINYWGKLIGINNIKAPLRLSLSPFISLYGEHFPYNTKGKSNFSYSVSGGLDLKYGINESYTMDVTLLPDFSQVQSDYEVKNISAFETVYSEYRPFFNEAIDLFKTGDLFYSRRIGRTPMGFYGIADSARHGEAVVKNPSRAKLINAIKLSGRGKNGMAIGIFNAITNNAFAEIKDSIGNKRKVLTEPLTNYNIFVLDQIFRNNSKIYFVNTNVIRTKGFDDSNVSLFGFELNNKKNVYRLAGYFGLSQQYIKVNLDGLSHNVSLGYKYSVSFSKVSGKFLFSVFRNELDDTYDANDMGLTLQNNQTSTGATLNYSIYDPFWIIRNMENRLEVTYTENFLSKFVEGFEIKFVNVFTTKSYLTIWDAYSITPIKTNNYAEARFPGRYFVMDKYFSFTLGFSSDYRKKFALDGEFNYWQEMGGDGQYSSIEITPIYRINDHLRMTLSSQYEDNTNDIGFVDVDPMQNILFGKRDITYVENTLTCKYLIKNKLSLGLNLRHYWSKGRYSEIYKLANDGQLISDYQVPSSDNYDFNFNAFNVDIMFLWEFAPGSSLNITYKNNIFSDNKVVVPSYFDNVKNIFENPMLNSISIKVLYYLDYQNIQKKFTNKNKHGKS